MCSAEVRAWGRGSGEAKAGARKGSDGDVGGRERKEERGKDGKKEKNEDINK